MSRPALDDETVEEQVTARLARQEIFQRKPLPVMSFIVQEVVLHYPYGGHAVLRGQWRRLLQVGRMRNVELQVMPTDREEHACDSGPLTLLRPRGRADDGLRGGAGSRRTCHGTQSGPPNPPPL